MASKSSIVNILQFDERQISLLRAQRSSRAIELVSYDVEQGEWSMKDGSLEKALVSFAQRFKLAGAEACTVLPRHELTTRILTLPSQSLDEIAGMVKLGGEEYTPYPSSELVVDECILRTLANGESVVLAVYAHKDVVETRVNLMRAAGVEPEAIYVSSACLTAAAVAAKSDETDCYAVVNLASSGIEAVVINGTRLEHIRGVATVQDWSLSGASADETAEELAMETKASLSAHRRESEEGAGAVRLFLCSDSFEPATAKVALEERVSIPCETADFVLSLVSRGADHVTAIPAVALGAVLSTQGKAKTLINLEPESLRCHRASTSTRRQATRLGALAAFIAIGLAALFWQAVSQRQSYLHDLESRLRSIRPRARQLIEKQKQLMTVQEHVDRSHSPLEALAAIVTVAPDEGLNVSVFKFDRTEGVTLEGRARKENDAYDFAQQIRDVGAEHFPAFAQARVSNNTRESEQKAAVWHYQIQVPFAAQAPAEPSPSEQQPEVKTSE